MGSLLIRVPMIIIRMEHKSNNIKTIVMSSIKVTILIVIIRMGSIKNKLNFLKCLKDNKKIMEHIKSLMQKLRLVKITKKKMNIVNKII